MKASLPLNEPKQLAAWQDANLYEAILGARKGKPLFVLHDGPPYPTGTIHLGTGLNKILKDLIVKKLWRPLRPVRPAGLHGLPIETQVEKELGGKGKVPPAEFSPLCREFATRYVEQHKRDFSASASLAVERSLSHDEPRIRSHHCQCLSRLHRKGLRLPRPQNRLLVHLRFNRARRKQKLT